MKFRQPTIKKNSAGVERRVGFEMEYGGTDLDTTAACIMHLYGGNHIRHSTFLQEVQNTELGTFHLKMDARMLTEKSYEKTLEQFGIDTKNNAVEEFVEDVASFLVPYEIGAPPVPFGKAYKIDELREALMHYKAQGTKSGFYKMYAMHINAELPDFTVDTVLRYLRAFLLLYPALFDASEITMARRLSPYIKAFEEEYIKLVLDENYAPEMEKLIRDYHAHNPDRNRPLDFYPCFACINKELVASFNDIGNVKPRPALHYRLPNSLIDDPDWNLAVDWNKWVAVEELAAQPEVIRRLSIEYLTMDENTYFGFSYKWKKRTEEFLK